MTHDFFSGAMGRSGEAIGFYQFVDHLGAVTQT